jgi:hypothetical protein
MPLSPGLDSAHHGVMPPSNLIPTARMTAETRTGRRMHPSVLVADPADPERLVLRSTPPWIRLLAHLLAHSLDRRLASGDEAESGRLLATRASHLVSTSHRVALTRNWNHLVARASSAPAARTAYAPLCRDRILGAQGDIRAMTDALSKRSPTAARGVAIADLLLRDASSPLYSRHCGTDLAAVLREVVAALDPAASPSRPNL